MKISVINRSTIPDLEVQKAIRSINRQIPLHLKDQLDRASSSIALNLAEGSANFPKDPKR